MPDAGTINVMEVMGRAVAARAESLDITFGDESKTIASGIYHLLVQPVSGSALVVAMKMTKGNALLAWHRLKEECGDSGGHRSVAMLMGLINPQWGTRVAAKE